MNNLNYFEDTFKSIPDYRKKVILRFLIINDVDLSTECGILKNDINHLCLEFEENLMEQNEDYLD